MNGTLMWLVILVAGAGTYLLRLSFLALLRDGTIGDRGRRVLHLIPAAVLAALALPAILSSGQATNDGGVAESETVLDVVGPAMRDVGKRAAAALGVRLAGVDIIAKDPNDAGIVLEVNTTPGLQWHYLVRNTEEARKVAIPVLATLLAS